MISLEWILKQPRNTHPLLRLMKNCKRSNSGCWEMQTNIDRCGYGRFKIGGRQLGAHKIAYILLIGDYDQSNLELMHSCDNPRCINPDHLKPATHKENMHDAISKGRMHGYDRIVGMNGVIKIFSSREIAKGNGEKYYIGGRSSCKKHNSNYRLASNGRCVYCIRDRRKIKFKNSRVKVRNIETTA